MYPRRYANYVLLERLGVGGMSEVDLARKVVEEAAYVRFLVIKRIKADRHEDAAAIRMFKDEARITAELHHGNIAQTYDFGRDGNEYYLVLEYIPGVDGRQILAAVREKKQQIPLRVILRICCDVLDGLHYAHMKLDSLGRPMEIIHRDVNPRNLMVSLAGEVKLIDFGVAKAQGRLEKTATDHVKGKFAYMSPEQVSSAALDHRVDQFALALTLHELIAGYGPLYGLSQVQIMHRLVSGSLPEIPGHPDLPDPTSLRRVLKKALAVRPDDRYKDCDTFRRELFVAQLEPGLEERIHARLTQWSGPIDLPPEAPPEPVAELPAAERTGPGTGSMAAMHEIPEVPDLPAPPPAASSGVGAGGLLVGGGLVLLALVAIVAVLVFLLVTVLI